ncbi:ferrochelatase [Candidatus Arsenophonus lipoptenae]|uniref:ferrochelatase n=1 Tax=Candidatus Arsenophonus lipoptenae TaxID=634113 RepID=UPI00083733F3
MKRYGVLLVNLGTPKAANTEAVKKFLAEFLSDIRIINFSPIIWKLLLHLIILPLRSPKLAKLYESIWTKEGSPLLIYSLQQKIELKKKLSNIPVELGMSYGMLPISEAINKLLTKKVENIIILPLYPQYSNSTTAVVFDMIIKILKKYQIIPRINFIRSYADHPYYIEILKKSVELSFKKYGIPERLILSYHGIPKYYEKKGDIYPKQCELTTYLFSKLIKFPTHQIIMAYQSKFGYRKWTKPYTNTILKFLAKNNIKHVQILCPGFSVDSLETLWEISIRNKDLFLKYGGEQFHYIPALNATKNHIILMTKLIINKI